MLKKHEQINEKKVLKKINLENYEGNNNNTKFLLN